MSKDWESLHRGMKSHSGSQMNSDGIPQVIKNSGEGKMNSWKLLRGTAVAKSSPLLKASIYSEALMMRKVVIVAAGGLLGGLTGLWKPENWTRQDLCAILGLLKISFVCRVVCLVPTILENPGGTTGGTTERLGLGDLADLSTDSHLVPIDIGETGSSNPNRSLENLNSYGSGWLCTCINWGSRVIHVSTKDVDGAICLVDGVGTKDVSQRYLGCSLGHLFGYWG